MHAIKEIEVQVQEDKGCVILDLETHSIQAKFKKSSSRFLRSINYYKNRMNLNFEKT